MGMADELKKLDEMRQTGAISDEEYAAAKAKIIGSGASADEQTRQWSMFLHLSMLAGFLVPFAGLILPIVIWQMKKRELPGIDVHGKNAANWIISAFMYGAACAILMLILIGIPLMIILGLLSIVFPIIAGVKANNGEVWKYPLAITFLK